MKGKAAIGFIFVTLLVDVIGWGLIIPVMPSTHRRPETYYREPGK